MGAPPRPPSVGSARSGLSRPASLNCVSTASSTPRGAPARPQPSAPPKAVPRGKSKERQSFEQKLEKRDMLVNCILNNEVPNRQRSLTPSRRQQPGTPARAGSRVGNQGARTSARARSRSQSIPPDDVDGGS